MIDKISEYNRIKTLALTAIFIDDELLDKLVLKGGNAVDLVYKIAARASLDLDLSLGGDLTKEEGLELQSRIKTAIEIHFKNNGYIVIDWTVKEHPPEADKSKPPFWGGYQASFKIVTPETFDKLKDNPLRLSQNAIAISPTQQKRLEIDISKFEFTGKNSKVLKELDGYLIYVYTPITLVFGKIRALCQQTKEYFHHIGRRRSPNGRARDFFDIYHILESGLINKEHLFSKENLSIFQEVFTCKEVDLNLLEIIPKYYENHKQTFISVKNTVYPNTQLEDFNFYYAYTMEFIEKLKQELKITGII